MSKKNLTCLKKKLKFKKCQRNSKKKFKKLINKRQRMMTKPEIKFIKDLLAKNFINK